MVDFRFRVYVPLLIKAGEEAKLDVHEGVMPEAIAPDLPLEVLFPKLKPVDKVNLLVNVEGIIDTRPELEPMHSAPSVLQSQWLPRVYTVDDVYKLLCGQAQIEPNYSPS